MTAIGRDWISAGIENVIIASFRGDSRSAGQIHRQYHRTWQRRQVSEAALDRQKLHTTFLATEDVA